MTEDDEVVGYRLRMLFTLADELRNVSEACRDGGAPLDLLPLEAASRPVGLEALRVRERRRPRMSNEIGPHLEQRIVAFLLAHPGVRAPRRISAELAQDVRGYAGWASHGVMPSAANRAF